MLIQEYTVPSELCIYCCNQFWCYIIKNMQSDFLYIIQQLTLISIVTKRIIIDVI
jgi:hypothetical protein